MVERCNPVIGLRRSTVHRFLWSLIIVFTTVCRFKDRRSVSKHVEHPVCVGICKRARVNGRGEHRSARGWGRDKTLWPGHLRADRPSFCFGANRSQIRKSSECVKCGYYGRYIYIYKIRGFYIIIIIFCQNDIIRVYETRRNVITDRGAPQT